MHRIIICIFFVMTFICSCSDKSETAVDWFKKAEAIKNTDPEKTIEYLNNGIKLQPKVFAAYYNRAIAYEKLGQHQHAIEDFNEAISLKPDNANSYHNRGVTYTVLLQYQRAIEDYNKVISLKPDFADAYKCRGYVYFKQGNKKLGCPDAKKACALGDCKLSEMAKDKGYCR
jgi:tetratricopeptide (TPR) repeat protein